MNAVNHVDKSEIKNLIHSAIKVMDLNLSGQTVLTEAASDIFACTAITAAMAGAQNVFAVTRDSRYGSAQEVISWNADLARYCGVEDKIKYSESPPIHFAPNSDIVTNLGFVRPINAELIAALPESAAISLMWEPWEFRKEDLDLDAAKSKNIPVAGTKEDHPHLKTMNYLGDVALKLLNESQHSYENEAIGVLGSYPFGAAIHKTLSRHNLNCSLNPDNYHEYKFLILAENISANPVIQIKRLKSDCILIHIAGVIDEAQRKARSIVKHPDIEVGPHSMTVTTAYASPKAVIDLHCAGLKVGSVMNRSMRQTPNSEIAVQKAVESGYGAALFKRNAQDYVLE